MKDEANDAVSRLNPEQRARLLQWPHDGSTFTDEPDAVAHSLCALGIGAILPWKHGCQMGLTAKGPVSGLKVHALLKSESPHVE